MFDDEEEVMIFPDVEVSDDGTGNGQIQLRSVRQKANNNHSVMTNFNPLTALDTYENNHFDTYLN